MIVRDYYTTLNNREADIIVQKKDEIVVKQFECLDRNYYYLIIPVTLIGRNCYLS